MKLFITIMLGWLCLIGVAQTNSAPSWGFAVDADDNPYLQCSLQRISTVDMIKRCKPSFFGKTDECYILPVDHVVPAAVFHQKAITLPGEACDHF